MTLIDKFLYQLFLDLKKAYDKVHRGRSLDTLRAYGAGPGVLRLIKNFWDNQRIVPHQSGYYGTSITATGGTAQGGIFSPWLFNIKLMPSFDIGLLLSLTTLVLYPGWPG